MQKLLKRGGGGMGEGGGGNSKSKGVEAVKMKRNTEVRAVKIFKKF